MEHFEHRAVIKLRANSGMTHTQTWYGFSNNNCGNACSMVIVFDWYKQFCEDRAYISDDFRSGRSCIYNSAKNVQTCKLRGTWFQSREEFEFAVCRAVARFGFDFYKDISSGWIERHMKCSAYQGSYFEKE